MHPKEEEMKAMLGDLIKINAVMATEIVQLVENSSRQIRGEVPETCVDEHRRLKKEIIEIAQKWHSDCQLLRFHNLKHE